MYVVLIPMFAVGLFDKHNNNTLDNNVTSAKHRDLARQIVVDSLWFTFRGHI